MNYPKKIEINIENDAQLALLYSCFNVYTVDVIKNMRTSVNEKIQKMATYFEEATNKSDASCYIASCWKKVMDMLPDTLTVPEFSVLLAALEKAGLTEKVVKKKSKDNIAKIVVEMSRHNNEEYVKILEFKNIKMYHLLPNKYIEHYPKFYLTPCGKQLIVNFRRGNDSTATVYEYIFEIGNVYQIGDFKRALELMKEAGKRLTQINREEKQLSILKSTVVVKEFSI